MSAFVGASSGAKTITELEAGQGHYIRVWWCVGVCCDGKADDEAAAGWLCVLLLVHGCVYCCWFMVVCTAV